MTGGRVLVLLGLLLLMGDGEARAQLSSGEHSNLVRTSRWMAEQGIGYNRPWSPPSFPKGQRMDCSNTSRILYRLALGKVLPRTASDQYYTLKLEGRVVEAPLLEGGQAGEVDTRALLGQLRSGDLLFWEWTYNIKRRPPITHVMVYLGQTAEGVAMMAGSQSGGRGERTSKGGVDVYRFDPNAPMGGVKDFWGNYIHKARFVGYGRPE